MARKSRKDLIRAENSGQTAAAVQSKPCPEPAPTYLAVGYARLSIFETRDRADSEALQNQKELLRQYIANAPGLQAFLKITDKPAPTLTGPVLRQ